MSFNASIFLALRYLRPQRTFVSILTLLAMILGPILGIEARIAYTDASLLLS
jgi:hypothetical protein